jgi:hypothetical protein
MKQKRQSRHGSWKWRDRHEGKIKVLRSDRGGEFCSNDFREWLTSLGILQDLSCSYSPQMNGKAERMNRTLAEMVRCMLFNREVPKKYWSYAFLHAAWIQNRCPTKRSKRRTAYQVDLWEITFPGWCQSLWVHGTSIHSREGRKRKAGNKLDPRSRWGIHSGTISNLKCLGLPVLWTPTPSWSQGMPSFMRTSPGHNGKGRSTKVRVTTMWTQKSYDSDLNIEGMTHFPGQKASMAPGGDLYPILEEDEGQKPNGKTLEGTFDALPARETSQELLYCSCRGNTSSRARSTRSGDRGGRNLLSDDEVPDPRRSLWILQMVQWTMGSSLDKEDTE